MMDVRENYLAWQRKLRELGVEVRTAPGIEDRLKAHKEFLLVKKHMQRLQGLYPQKLDCFRSEWL